MVERVQALPHAVGVAEASFGGGSVGIGAKIEIESEQRPEFLLFHEAPSRILVATSHADEVKKIAAEFNVECPRIGATMKGRLQIRNGAVTLIDLSIDDLREPWEKSLPRLLDPEAHA